MRLLAFLGWASMLAPAASASLKGETKTVRGLKWTPIKLAAVRVIWADVKAQSAYMLDDKGVVRLVSVPDFKELAKAETNQKVASIALSSVGLLLGVPSVGEVWILDPKNLATKHQIKVPGLVELVCAPRSKFAFVTNKTSIGAIDLKRRKLQRVGIARGAKLTSVVNPVLTADGKYLFLRDGWRMMRIAIRMTALKPEQMSFEVASGNVTVGIQVSPDGKHVCYPSGGGNRNNLAGHPPISNYGTFIYPLKNLRKPAFTIDQGAYPAVVGFDVKRKLVIAPNYENRVQLFTYTGVRKAAWRLDKLGDPKQILTHPAGGNFLLRTDKHLLWIELPAKLP